MITRIGRNAKLKEVRVWDFPTRVFHGLFTASFVVALLSNGNSQYLDVHVFAGYVFTMLFVFRLVWGLIGTHYVRIGQLVFRWPHIKRYVRHILRGHVLPYAGHNPISGILIGLMLLLGLLLIITGFITFGGEEKHGPYANWFSFQTGLFAHSVHEILAWLMATVVVLHIVLLLFQSTNSRINSIGSMWHGKKMLVSKTAAVANHRVIGLALVAVFALFTGFSFKGYVVESGNKLYRPFVGPKLAQSTSWKTECGQCHMPFHPSLLPARSWVAMLIEPENHFGENLDLKSSTIDGLIRYAVQNSAENELTETASQIVNEIPAYETPLRITETKYWTEKHQRFFAERWRAKPGFNTVECESCHLDAREGTFQDAAIRIPQKGVVNSIIQLATEQMKDKT